MATVKVLLLAEVEHLGPRGNLVNVADGYARNYLFPRKLATLATEGVEEFATRLQASEAKRRTAEHAQLVELAGKLTDVSCSIPRKAHDDEKLFGSVSAGDISASLGSQGFKVDKKHIVLAEPIKTLGVFTVPVNLGQSVSASVKVWVVRETGKA